VGGIEVAMRLFAPPDVLALSLDPIASA